MEVLTTTVPGLDHGTMYRVNLDRRVSVGFRAAELIRPATAPSFNENRIFAGEGFRYVNDGTGLGLTESIPVRFSDSTGSTTATDTLVIHITSPAGMPAITTQPVGASISSGQTATMSVAASGSAPLSYQWYSGLAPNTANPIAGATSSSFTTPVLDTGGQYLYWVRASNGVGVANSLNATVTVTETTTTATSSLATVTYSTSPQSVNWEATVTRATAALFGIPDGGVTFSVAGVGSPAGNVGFTSISPGVVKVTGTFTVPGQTPSGVYPISVTYHGSIPLYLGSSSDNGASLTIVGGAAQRSAGSDHSRRRSTATRTSRSARGSRRPPARRREASSSRASTRPWRSSPARRSRLSAPAPPRSSRRNPATRTGTPHRMSSKPWS